MPSAAIKNPYRKPYKFQTTIMTVNRRMYSWADSLFYDQLITGSILHTLKAIIATRHLKQPTIQQINDARTRSASTKFAQSDSVTNRTILRHVEKLQSLKYIIIEKQKNAWYSRNSYHICVPDDYLVKAPSDMMSPSLSCSYPSLREGVANMNYKKNNRPTRKAALASPWPSAGSPAACVQSPTPEPQEKAWQDEMCEQYIQQEATQSSSIDDMKEQTRKKLYLLKQSLRR